MNAKALLLKLTIAVVGLITSLSVWAAATLQSSSGEIRATVGGREVALTVNQRVDAGSSVTTGENSQAILRFDDGQLVALSANTSFKLEEYQFNAAKPEQGNSLVSLLKGSLRFVTGLIGKSRPERVALRTPNATIGIRGTDFMVAQVNPTFLTVIQGAVSTANLAGSMTFASGATGLVASSTTLATSIATTALPTAVSSAFSQLGALQMSGAAGLSSSSGTSSGGASSAGSSSAGASGTAGAGGAAGGATAGTAAGVATGTVAGTVGTAGVVAAGVAGVAAAIGGSTSTQTPGH